MTSIDRYQAALADVNQTIATASGGVTSYAALLALVMLGAVAARPWAQVRDQIDAGFRQAINLGPDNPHAVAAIEDAANLMELLAARARAALLQADGSAKPFAEDAAIEQTAAIGDDVREGAKNLAGAAGTLLFGLELGVVLALAVGALLLYKYFEDA